MVKKLFIVIPFLFTLHSCASVERFVEDRDYSGADKYCSQKIGAEKNQCFKELAAVYLDKKYYGRSYDTYMKLGEETGNQSYFVQAGDIAAEHLHPQKAFDAYEAGGDTPKIKQLALQKSTVKDWKRRNIHPKALAKIAEKYHLKKVFLNLGELSLSYHFLAEAAGYFKKSGDTEKATMLFIQAGDAHYKRKEYASAAGNYAKAGRQLMASDAYIKAAESQLKFKNPFYQKILELYEKAGEKVTGQKKVAIHMIEHRNINSGLKMAKSVGPAFYREALIKAGDMNINRSEYRASLYYKDAGVADPNLRIARHYLSRKTLNFNRAEKYLKKSKLKDYTPLLLERAIENNNSRLIARYAAGAQGSKMHEKIGQALINTGSFDQAYAHFQKAGQKKGAGWIASAAEKQGKTDTAARFYFLAGNRQKAAALFRKQVQNTIKNQKFIQDYLKWKDFPKGLMGLYWGEVMAYSRKFKNILFLQPVFELLKERDPLLALGYLHNSHRGAYFREAAASFAKGKSEFSVATGQKYMDIASMYTKFNNLLTVLLKGKKMDTSKYAKGMDSLRMAEKDLVRENYKRCLEHLEEAQKLFVN